MSDKIIVSITKLLLRLAEQATQEEHGKNGVPVRHKKQGTENKEGILISAI